SVANGVGGGPPHAADDADLRARGMGAAGASPQQPVRRAAPVGDHAIPVLVWEPSPNIEEGQAKPLSSGGRLGRERIARRFLCPGLGGVGHDPKAEAVRQRYAAPLRGWGGAERLTPCPLCAGTSLPVECRLLAQEVCQATRDTERQSGHG